MFLSDPHDIKDGFTGDQSAYRAGEANAVLRGLLGDNSLLVLDGDLHREWRRLLLAALGRDTAARHTDMITEVTARNVRDWPLDRQFPVARRLVHACPESYPEPTRFRPERFISDRLNAATWIPFGGGNRRCPGAAFASLEMRIVLRELLCRVDFNLSEDGGERQRVRHVTLVPHRGARISVGPVGPTGCARRR